MQATGSKPANTFVPIVRLYCDGCGGPIASSLKPSPEPPQAHSCSICNDVSYDLCASCYDAGKWCLDPKHDLRLQPLVSLQYIHHATTMTRLSKSASRGNAEAFRTQAKIACRGKIFFGTKQGWIGQGPEELQRGDVVAVLFGGPVPFILRRYDAYYRLIECCYVYGLMDGEANEMAKIGQLVEEEFELR